MERSRKNGELVLAAMAGALTGTAVDLLYAPDSGKNTRDKIKRGAERTSERLGKAALELKGSVVDILDYEGDELGYLIGSAIAKR